MKKLTETIVRKALFRQRVQIHDGSALAEGSNHTEDVKFQ